MGHLHDEQLLLNFVVAAVDSIVVVAVDNVLVDLKVVVGVVLL